MDVHKSQSSDGNDGLPPIYTQKGKKKKKNRSLHTTSAPLTPDTSSIVHQSPVHLQQPSRLCMSSSRPMMRRSTVSDAGGQLMDAEVSVQLAPVSDRYAAGSKSTDGAAADTASNSSSCFAGLEAAQEAQSSSRGVVGSTAQQPAAISTAQQSPAVATPGGSSHHQQPHFAGSPASTAPSLAHVGRPLQSVMSIEVGHLAPPPSLWEFFYAEATPHEKYPTADVLWRQTERDRVYNFLLYVPYQLERIMIFGTLLCLYSFLGALTVLPLRCLRTLWQVVSSVLSLGSRASSSSSRHSNSRLVPSGAQLYDLLCAVLLLGAVFMLSLIQPGVIYYWMKDITSEFLKIQIIFTALEILDRILSNFGVDVLEALSSTCTLFTRHSIGLMPLISDFLVALLLITVHGSVLMCQAMVFAVTMNSKANALLALMIATNFVELKGQVYKRTDTNKLWTLACQDIVERFELLLVLCFVVVEDISNGGTWTPAAATLLVCGRIYIWEIIIDIAKHAVLGKFNDIRPGIYREYMRDLCSDSLDNHSHNVHKLVGFCPLGSAALCLRMLHTLFTLKGDGTPQWHLRLALLLLLLLGACVFQVILGFSLKWLAYLYVQHHALQAGGKSQPRAINVTPAGAKLVRTAAGEKGSAAQAAAAAAAPAAATGVPGSGLVAYAAPGAAAAAVPGRSSVLASQVSGQGLQGAAVTAAAVASAPGSSVDVKQTQSDEGQVAYRLTQDNRSGQRRPPAAAGGGNVVHWDEQLPSSSRVNDGSGSSRNKQDSRSSRSTIAMEGSQAGMRLPGTAGAANLQSAVGLSSSYTAPSQAGMNRRTYTKSVSCADMSNTHSRQPGIVAAQD